MDSAGTAPQVRGRVLFVLLMQCLVVLACVGATTAIAAAVQERSIRTATSERVLGVARSLAALDQVRSAVVLPLAQATAELQPLADLVAEASGVDYVVITDADGIRITHPTEAERGKPVSTDPSGVLAGETFLGTETGTLGPTLRAKVPVRDGDRVIGAASVGILESEIAADFTAALSGLIPWVIGSVLVGCLASAALTSLVRRRVRRLEAHSRELQSQRRVASALREQTHEFHTRLHVIRGLVAEGDDDGALDYIADLVPVTTTTEVAVDVGDPRLRALLEATGSELVARAGRLEIDEHTSVPRAILDDDDLLVVANLCRNAAEAAHGVVRVLVQAGDGHVHIEVADDGPGVAPELLGRIFERGVSTKDGNGARGVGLDLVRRIVGGRDGTIDVGTSALGGALFVVDVPAATGTKRR